MKTLRCSLCGQVLSVNEVALNQRLLGMQIGRFFCLGCLAPKLNTTVSHLERLIARFREMGCAYFTRLMEDPSYEHTHDHLPAPDQ